MKERVLFFIIELQSELIVSCAWTRRRRWLIR